MDLSWETASELDNLGFHLYRSVSADGPYERITSALIPGLGSSPVRPGLRYRDAGLRTESRTTTSSRTSRPRAASSGTAPCRRLRGSLGCGPGGDGGRPAAGGGGSGSGRTAHGDPSATSLTVLERGCPARPPRTADGWLLLRSEPATEAVELEVPGFEPRPVRVLPISPCAHMGRRHRRTQDRLTSVEAQDPFPSPTSGRRRRGRPASTSPETATVRRPTSAAEGSRPVLAVATTREVRPPPRGRLPAGDQEGPPRAVSSPLQRRLRRSSSSPVASSSASSSRGRDSGEISLGGARGRTPARGRTRPLAEPSSSWLARRASTGGVRGGLPGSARDPPEPAPAVPKRVRTWPSVVDRPAFGPGASLYFLSEGAS